MRLILKLLTGVFVCILLSCTAYAQGENNIWTFGYFLSMNFNVNPPVLGSSSLMSHEGCAAICDPNGNLLFYSNGNDLWDRTHTVTPNGSGILSNTGPLGSTGSSLQGVALMPFIEDTNKYYLFVLESFEAAGGVANIKLRYNVIDKSLNGGLGDVVAGQKNIVLDVVGSEKMVMAKGAGCYNWLIVHRGQSNEFVAWKIEPSGINLQKVISPSGGGTNHMSSGEMKISHDYKKIALSVYTENTIEIHDFDRATGVVSNARIVDTAYNSPMTNNMLLYGMEFSPDNNKLYYSQWGNNHLYQLDLSLLPDLAATRASKTSITSNGGFLGMRIGPDGKLYMAHPSSNSISRINFPNNPGLSCGLDATAIYAGGNIRWGLGSRVVTNPKDTFRHKLDTAVCFSMPFTYQAAPNSYSYAWSNGDNTAATTFTTPGMRTLIAYDGCRIWYDTVVVMGLSLDTIKQTHQQITCFNGGSSTVLTAPFGNQSYLWSTGASTQQITITAPGTYSVVSTNNCDIKIDTFVVAAMPLTITALKHDTTVCLIGGNSFQISSSSTNPLYLWNTGFSAPQLNVNQAGIYYVSATSACNVDVDTFVVNARSVDTNSRLIDTVICFQNTVLLHASPGYEVYQWQAGGMQQSQWVNTAQPAMVSAYSVAQCAVLLDTFRFDNVNFQANLGPDREMCEGDSILLQMQTDPQYEYIWSDGSTLPSLMAYHPDVYRVSVSHKGCNSFDTIQISKRIYEINLGADKRLCVGESLLLDASLPGSSYEWSTGSVAPSIQVSQSGMYSVRLKDGICFAQDSIYVDFVHCDNCLRLPNAFSPNGDGLNDVFGINPVCPVATYQIKIFDRWGKQVFGSLSLNNHWDGTLNGQPLDMGVYFYSINIRYDLPNAKNETLKGDVTLIR